MFFIRSSTIPKRATFTFLQNFQQPFLPRKSFSCLAPNLNVNDAKQVRVRFAPSPTGLLHLGGLRTALFNYLFAKNSGGSFILRIEDTDQSRLVPGALGKLVEDLKWAGLTYDEGPDVGGTYGPYVQSKRLDIYKKHVDELIQNGHAYRCFCTPEKLEGVRAAKKKLGLPSVYDGSCRTLDDSKRQVLLESNQPHVVRFKASDASETKVFDEIRGQLTIKHVAREDFIIFKSDGYPTYHLASVIDDHLMKITHVLRGEEWVMSLDKHLALYAAFGWSPPRFVHLPLLLNPDSTKLSKRSGDVHCEAYKAQGYLADALVNFVAFLGWSPVGSGNEVMRIQELAQLFSIKDINISSPKVFSQKLRWFNQQHLAKHCDDPFLRAPLVSFLCKEFRSAYFRDDSDPKRFEPAYIEKVLVSMKGRIFVLPELVSSVPYFFVTPNYQSLFADPSSVIGKFFSPLSADLHRDIVALAIRVIGDSTSEYVSAPELDALFQSASQTIQGAIKKDVQLALRLSLTASKMGPPLVDIFDILGRKCALDRLSLFLNCHQIRV